MLAQKFQEICISTKGRGFYEFTDEVVSAVRLSGFESGLATIHLRHTSASLLVQENADPDVRSDLERFFNRLIPDGDQIFQHVCEGKDDMPAHVRSALTSVNLSIPFRQELLELGTWQGIYLWEHRLHAHRRRIALHLLGE